MQIKVESFELKRKNSEAKLNEMIQFVNRSKPTDSERLRMLIEEEEKKLREKI